MSRAYSGPDNPDRDPRQPPDWACGRTMFDHLKAITWCLAELRWQYNNHGHGLDTGWSPVHPHWL